MPAELSPPAPVAVVVRVNTMQHLPAPASQDLLPPALGQLAGGGIVFQDGYVVVREEGERGDCIQQLSGGGITGAESGLHLRAVVAQSMAVLSRSHKPFRETFPRNPESGQAPMLI